MITYFMVLSVPITNNKNEFAVRLWERDRNNVPVINHDGTKTPRRSLKVEWRGVEKASNLIFHLKLVSKVPSGRNRAVCTKNTVLPRVTPHLDARPISRDKWKNPKSILVFRSSCGNKEVIKNRQLLVSPSQEERLVQMIEDFNNNIVVGSGIKQRSWKLPIDSYNLNIRSLTPNQRRLTHIKTKPIFLCQSTFSNK